MSSELAIRVSFSSVFFFRLGLDTHSGTEHPTGYKVEFPSFVHCFGVHFFLPATPMSISQLPVLSTLTDLVLFDDGPSRWTYRVPITSFEPRSYHISTVHKLSTTLGVLINPNKHSPCLPKHNKLPSKYSCPQNY